MVTQENFMFDGTVADNIRFGRPDATDAEVRAAAAAVGADRFIEALPDGYETDVAARRWLSAGQRQLVAFARAFLADPAVLILDEATSSLDIPSERMVQRALETVLADRTAGHRHRLSTVEVADRVLVLEDGRIVEDGPPDELIHAATAGTRRCTGRGSSPWPDGRPWDSPAKHRLPVDPVGMATNTEKYRNARDQLVALIGDYQKAVDTFEWPRLTGSFNWATDWFDVIARDNDRTALWIVEEDGGEEKVTFAQMADRSDRVATWLAQQGVGKGIASF